jgi:uncharacterized OsmC-like protein
MGRSTDRSQDPSPFAWLMAGAVAAVGLGSVLAARRRRRAEEDLWAAAEARDRRPDPGDDEVAGHPS